MKNLIVTFIEGFSIILTGLILWCIIRFPQYLVYIFPTFLLLIIILHFIETPFAEMLILIVSILTAGLIIVLHPDKFDKIVVGIECFLFISGYTMLQNLNYKINSRVTFWVEQKENLEKLIGSLKAKDAELRKEIYNTTIQIKNYRAVEEIISNLSSITELAKLQLYVEGILKKLFANTVVKVYLETLPQEDSMDYTIIEYVRTKKKYLYIQDISLSSIKKELTIVPYRSVICCPLETKTQEYYLGYLILYSEQPIDEDVYRLVSLLGYYISVSLTNIKLFEQTKELAITDSLTGLFVQKYFKTLLEEEVKIAKYYGRDLSIAMFDIDNFKTINDTYGHNVGDEVLVKFSDVLRSRLRETDIIARYGGDEFIILLPNTPLKQAEKICEEIRNMVEKDIVVVPKQTIAKSLKGQPRVRFQISCGVADYKGKQDIYEIIDIVDRLLYVAKNSGKNKVVVG